MHRRVFCCLLAVLLASPVSAKAGDPLRIHVEDPMPLADNAGDTWVAAWAADGAVYTPSDDTGGFHSAASSNIAFNKITGDDVRKLSGATVNPMSDYGKGGQKGPDGCTWKSSGCCCLDGTIYWVVARHKYGEDSGDPKRRQPGANASIIKSTDFGKTWTRSAQENYQRPMFPGSRFATPYFVEYGQDGRASVDNADRYVYALSNDGFWDNGNNLILGRVARSKIGNLRAADWQYYQGGDGMDDAAWTSRMARAKLVLDAPGKLGMNGAVYVPGLRRYIMIGWYYPGGGGKMQDACHTTNWDFYEASKPWGPWTKISTYVSHPQGYYSPQICPKFSSADGRSLFVMTAGDWNQPNYYRLTIVPLRVEGDYELSNAAYRLGVRIAKDEVHVALDDKKSGLRLAEGPYFYRAARQGKTSVAECHGLSGASVERSGSRLTIRGTIAGVEVEHIFDLPADRPILEERFLVHNRGDARVRLTDFQAGFMRPMTDAAGNLLPDLADGRFVAIPFRARPDDARDTYNDFSTADLIEKKGYEARVLPDQHYDRVEADRRQSEGWAWTHGDWTLGIFKFDQENMQWSALAVDRQDRRASLRFGGVAMIDGEPSDLGRIEPGQTVRLGATRYQTVAGDYRAAMYAFRRFLDANGCRFPKGFDPPVHWEQLYDMEGAWDDRAHRYTKAIVEKEAQKGVAYSCEALYLDPGWDTGFATFLWGDAWLGPRRAFVAEMQSKYGLKVSLHTPLASWMSVHGPMGPDIAPATYPASSLRKAPLLAEAWLRRVPAMEGGRRNLALLPDAKANASSVWADGGMPIHQVRHLNDGWCGNKASWIAKTRQAWAEIDLGATYTISRVRLSNDESRQYTDRKPVDYRLLAATKYDAQSRGAAWKTLAEVSGEPLLGGREFSFSPCQARWVRVQIDRSEPNEPRLDEIQVYEDRRLLAGEAALWESQARRAAPPLAKSGASTICLGAKAYLDEAARRLLDNCADGIAFLMFDGNWYQGGCDDPRHGHPVPFTKEDHMRANVELARRVHEKYPAVLIEMHDMMTGGANPRNTPVYYKYGLPGSYDSNWGFELMWNPMDDIIAGRARSLYYYNLSCNVPIYLHVDLRKDTPGCALLWWYASTCRHLGIGGTHRDPAVVAAQKAAMRRYHELERFFKRGEFYGINEEVHLHALPEENAFVVNLFNLSDHQRTVGGSIELARMGLSGQRLKQSGGDAGSLERGIWTIHRQLPPWSSQLVYVRL